MKGKTVYLIAALAAVLVLIVLVLEKPFTQRSGEETTPRDLEAIKRLPVFDKVSAKDSFKIQIFNLDDKTSVTLTQIQDVWAVNPERKYPVAKNNITRLFDTLKDVKDGEVVSRNPQNHMKFEVHEEHATRVKFYGKNDELQEDLFVGKTGMNYMAPSTYARKAGSDEVLLVNGFMSGVFPSTEERWRERTMIDVDREQISEFIIRQPEQPEIKIARLASEDWTCLEPKSFLVRSDVGRRMINSFARLQAASFISDYPQKPLEDYGLGKDAIAVTAILRDHSTTPTLHIGKESEEKRTQWYARAEGQDTVYLISKYARDSVVKNLEELEPTPTPTPSPTEKSLTEQLEEKAEEQRARIENMTQEQKDAAVQKKLDEILKKAEERDNLKKGDPITSPSSSTREPVQPSQEEN